jgi:hypothetical protein
MFIHTRNNYVFVCAMWGSYFHRNRVHSAHIQLTLKFRLQMKQTTKYSNQLRPSQIFEPVTTQ